MSITTNQPAVVDEDSFSVHRSIRIAASVGKVWEAVTVPEHISRWFEHTELDGDTQLTVVLHGRTQARPDDVVHLAIDAAKVHVFAGASGQRLG